MREEIFRTPVEPLNRLTFQPLRKILRQRPTQVAAMRLLLRENPQAAAMVPSGELGQLANVASVRALPIDQLGQYAQVINYYEHTLRPQITTSQLAPIVLRLGARLPIIGKVATIPKP